MGKAFWFDFRLYLLCWPAQNAHFLLLGIKYLTRSTLLLNNIRVEISLSSLNALTAVGTFQEPLYHMGQLFKVKIIHTNANHHCLAFRKVKDTETLNSFAVFTWLRFAWKSSFDPCVWMQCIIFCWLYSLGVELWRVILRKILLKDVTVRAISKRSYFVGETNIEVSCRIKLVANSCYYVRPSSRWNLGGFHLPQYIKKPRPYALFHS